MIYPLRRTHRRVFLLLAVALPMLVLAGLWVRPKQPQKQPVDRFESLANASAHPSGADSTPIADSRGCLGPQPIRLALLPRENGARAHRFEIAAQGSLVAPDLLVYLARSGSGGEPGTTPPSDAHLIGSLAVDPALRFEAFADDERDLGTLMLYSLAHSEAVGQVRLSDRPLLEACR